MKNNFTQKLLFFGAIALFFSACAPDNSINDGESGLDDKLSEVIYDASNGQGKSFFILPKSNELSKIPQDPKNPLSPVKIELGRRLYHETGLGTDGKIKDAVESYSCASCHFAGAGFQAGTFQGIGEGGMGFGVNGESRIMNPNFLVDSIDFQPIRTPTALNTAYQENMLWNGQFGATGLNVGTEAVWTPGTPKAVNELGYAGLETQAIAGLEVHRLSIENNLCKTSYKALFNEAFPDFPAENRVSKETAGLAIAAYERTLMAYQAPFQKWLKGNASAMDEQQKRGAIVFFKEGNCASCHTGPALNSMTFHALGMHDLDASPELNTAVNIDENTRRGRGGFTQNPTDDYKFKTPQLYNLEDSPFYGHGGNFRTVREIIEYIHNAGAQSTNVPNSQLATEFIPLNLTMDQINDLEIFLRYGLRDPDLRRYEPSSVASGNCFPNNDTQSRQDIGCE